MRITLLAIIIAALMASVWLIFNFEHKTKNGDTMSPTQTRAPHPEAIITKSKMEVASTSRPQRKFPVPASSDQAWIAARSASLEITQDIDMITDEPIGIVKMGDATGTLGETPPFYRLQLKTTKFPILLGEKDTRHHFIRSVSSVHEMGNELTLIPEVAVSYPQSASLGGFIFQKNEGKISQLGIIILEVIVPENVDPSSSQWNTTIRIADRPINAEELASIELYSFGANTVVVLPTDSEPLPTEAQILWLVLDANGSFTVAEK